MTLRKLEVAMVDTVSRELILPATRLDVPPRPSKQQIAALTERSADQWSTSPLTWVMHQVVRLAVAEVLRSRLEQRPAREEASSVGTDAEQVTLAQLATLFRPHVALATQAFAVGVVDAVNSRVPAATDPAREGLRRTGVTGREPLRMIALGLDKLPARARGGFWAGAKTSPTITAVVDALAEGQKEQTRGDVSGLDRSQLARADALLMAGGRMTPVVLSSRGSEGGASWLQVPLAITRRRHPLEPRRGGEQTTEVSLTGDGWVEVFDTALDAVGVAMAQLDQGGRPRGRLGDDVNTLSSRLAAAGSRTVAQVCTSLRAVDEFVLEMFDHQVGSAQVPVSVPALEDDLFVQLWLPASALAGPLFVGAADLFLGGAVDYRVQGGRSDARPRGRSGESGSAGSGRPGGTGGSGRRGTRAEGSRTGGGRREGPPDAGGGPGESESQTAGPGGRRRKKRPGGRGGPGEPGPAVESGPKEASELTDGSGSTAGEPASVPGPASESGPAAEDGRAAGSGSGSAEEDGRASRLGQVEENRRADVPDAPGGSTPPNDEP